MNRTEYASGSVIEKPERYKHYIESGQMWKGKDSPLQMSIIKRKDADVWWVSSYENTYLAAGDFIVRYYKLTNEKN